MFISDIGCKCVCVYVCVWLVKGDSEVAVEGRGGMRKGEEGVEG